jgi:hypothetical protein
LRPPALRADRALPGRIDEAPAAGHGTKIPRPGRS